MSLPRRLAIAAPAPKMNRKYYRTLHMCIVICILEGRNGKENAAPEKANVLPETGRTARVTPGGEGSRHERARHDSCRILSRSASERGLRVEAVRPGPARAGGQSGPAQR